MHDQDASTNSNSKFICHTFWATQFHALRSLFLNLSDESDSEFIRSLALSARYLALVFYRLT